MQRFTQVLNDFFESVDEDGWAAGARAEATFEIG